MTTARGRVVRAARAVASLSEHRAALPVVFGAGLVVYALVSFALPLQVGRDLPRYLLVYAELFDAHVVFPTAMLQRTPGTPIVVGTLLEAGPLAAELAFAVLYALSIAAWFCVARRYGPLVAVATAVALLAYPGYALLFHELASDALFAAAFALVALLVVRVVEVTSLARSAALGLGVVGLVLTRPVGQALVVLGLVPLVAARSPRGRFTALAGFAAAVVVPLLALSAHNALRADDFAIVRGGSASLLFRTFVADRIVRPENGPASEELARAVARQLLPNEPYRSRGIDLGTFFSSGSSRMNDDFIVLADRTWGWDDDYGHLARAAREAVRAHPGTYARGVSRDTRDVWKLLLWPVYAPVEDEAEPSTPSMPTTRSARTEASTSSPAPTGDDLIPSSREAPYISTPDGRIREVWTSPDDHAFVFRDAADRTGAAALDREVAGLLDGLPDRTQRPGLVRLVNDLSRIYPRPFMWLLVGLAAAIWRRPRGIAVPTVLAGSALLVLLSTSLAVYAVAEYAVPVVPAFVLLATAGVFGRRSTRAARARRLRSPVGHAGSAPRPEG